MNESDRWKDAFTDFDAFLPRRSGVLALVNALGALIGTVSFVLLAGIVLGRR